MSVIWLNVDAAVTVFVNLLPLIDDGDFKTVEDAVAYNAAGMDLRWNFITPAGVISSTAVTPTSGGDYDWTHVGDGIYKLEIPASGGASINNDTEGYGFISGKITGVLPFRGPIHGFRPALLNDALIKGTEFLPVDAHKQNFAVSAGSLTTKKPDGSTDTDYSPKSVTTDPAAEPITGAS